MFGDDDDLLAVLSAVADPERRPPLRPWGGPENLPHDMPRDFGGLILRCTHNDPTLRPSFDLIAQELKYMDLTSALAFPLSETEDTPLLGGGAGSFSGSPAAAAPARATAPATDALSFFPEKMAAALKAGRLAEPEAFEVQATLAVHARI